MDLQTIADIPFRSPLAEKEQLDATHPVALSDLSGRAVIEIRGDEAARVLRGVYDDDIPHAFGGVTVTADGALVRITDERFVLVGGHPDGGDAMDRIADAADGTHITVTDRTHGQGHMLLRGPDAANVLSKVCGLDFAERSFPDRHAAYSTLAKVRALLLRLDEEDTPAYHILVDYSLAAYTWDVVSDAMREFHE